MLWRFVECRKRGRGLNAKRAADNNSSLGAGSEKQTQHQATGSVSLGTKGRAGAFEDSGKERETGGQTDRQAERNIKLICAYLLYLYVER